MSYFSNLDIERQRQRAINDAARSADNAETTCALISAVLLGLGFCGFLLCAFIGARLTACYLLAFGFGGGAVLGLLSHVVREIVFIVKTWNV